MTVISTEVAFEAAHRQYGDPSKCGKLHGHNWVAVVSIEGFTNHLGYVIDFKDIKDEINVFDHVVVLHDKDPLGDVLRANDQKVVVLPDNPTCENIAKAITLRLIDVDHGHIKKVTVVLWENSKSNAKYTKRSKR